MRRFLTAILQKVDRNSMTYHGDVYHTPPVWIRIMMGAVRFIGGVLIVIWLSGQVQAIANIITVFILAFVLYLLATVPTAAKVATVTALFWGYLAAIALFWPVT